MKILFLSPSDHRDGSPDLVMAPHYLSQNGFKTTVCVARTKCGQSVPPKWYSTLVNWSYVGNQSLSNTPSVIWRISSLIKQTNPEIVYVLDGSVTPIAAVIARRFPRLKFVYHQQNFLEPILHPYRRFIEKSFAKRCHLIVMNEENRLRFFISSHKLNRKKIPCIVVPTLLPTSAPRPSFSANERSAFAAKNQIPVDAIWFFHIGSPSESRGWSMIKRMFNELLSRGNELVLIHTGNENDLVKSISSNIFHFRSVGRLPFDDIFDLAALSDVGLLIYPNDKISNFYQSPGRLTQYLRSGLPVLTPDYPGFRELTRKFNIGVSANLSDVIETSNEILKLASDAKRVGYREHIQTVADSTLSYERHGKKLLKALAELRILNQ